MRTTAIILSTLLAIVVSGAPIDPKLSTTLTEAPFPPTKPAEKLHVRRADLPAVDGIVEDIKLPTLPTLPKLPTSDLKLPVKRGDLPIVDGLFKDAKVPALPKLPSDAVKVPVKRAELPVVGGVVESVKVPSLGTLPTLPKLPIDNVNLPVRRADVRVVDGAIDGVDPKVHLPLSISSGHTKKATDYDVNAPINVAVDDALEVPSVNVPTVGVRQIKQSLPVVGGVDVPLDAGKIQVGTVDTYAEDVVKGTTGL